MQERPPSGSRGRKILFHIFEAEREVFHEPPLYPFERCETRPTGNLHSPGVESHCRYTPEPLQFRALAGAAQSGRAACLRDSNAARRANTPAPVTLWISRGKGE